MKISVATIAGLMLMFGAATSQAQQCLHGPNETPEQAARRTDAINAARAINTIQANHKGNGYFRHEDLPSSPWAVQMRQSPNPFAKRLSLLPGTEILPGWTLMFDVGFDNYWFKITDKTDPCGFALISNQAGIVFVAEPIR
ncbi:MAG TPA: hypothetical protein VFP91_19195 [Vicinamibacterales bacterium]|nr:hypothetical protein [Vicinamibacterales bacterium]